ncbi:myosin-2 essential light chain-like [Xenia sp. Carnegie-2017]|uniref:myosin-2 essential light chain-like n=1 Tax=Xenia sp. Carnegie-2017 TaxID=2897299 RepID=UPI001F049DBB|nr:myosin-2 essential light chain-like [Xenia sp. Carnegie-2017]
MSQSGIDDCRDIFSLYDRVGDNKIRVEHLGEVLRALGSNPTESEVAKLRQQFKIGKDVRISFEMFWSIFQATKPRVITPAVKNSFVECFKVFDRNENGLISSAEFRQLLTNLGDKLTDAEVDLLLAGHEDQNGQVQYENLVDIITSV